MKFSDERPNPETLTSSTSLLKPGSLLLPLLQYSSFMLYLFTHSGCDTSDVWFYYDYPYYPNCYDR